MNEPGNKIINVKKIDTIIGNSYLSIEHVKKKNKCDFFKEKKHHKNRVSYLLTTHPFLLPVNHWIVMENTNWIFLYPSFRKTN